MSTLKDVIDGLNIGASLANFVNMLSASACAGGLFTLTTKRGYRMFNAFGNYNGGTVGRYGYNTTGRAVEHENIMGNDFYVFENGQLMKPVINDSVIGEAYTIEYKDNGFRKTMTTEEFDEFGRLLMLNNLSENGEGMEGERNQRYIKYNDKLIPSKPLNDGGRSIGDLVDITVARPPKIPADLDTVYNGNGSVATMKEFKTKLLLTNEKLYGYSSNLPYYSYTKNKIRYRSTFDPVFKSQGEVAKSLTEVGNNERDKYVLLNRKLSDFMLDKMALHNTGLINAGPKANEYQVLPNALYGDLYSVSNKIENLEPIIPNGIYYGYTIARNNNFLKYNTYSYSYNSPYAISDVSQYIEKVDDVHNMPKFEQANIKNQGSGFISHNVKSNSNTFSYYEEPDGENKSVDSFKKASVIDNDTVTISKFNGSSPLIKRTNDLFKRHKINSLINRFHTNSEAGKDSDLITSYSEYGISRGRNLLKANHSSDDETGYNNPYCRVWTAHHQYSKFKDRIRPSEMEISVEYGMLRPENGLERLKSHSVLQESGLVRITPSHDKAEYDKKNNIKNYMFSIENLAWKDVPDAGDIGLSDEQRGPNGGRIMWFPPYNLKFTENVTAQWKDHDFIGRGEKIWTYTNTERSGTLNFTLLIDHPSIINKWRGTGDPADKEKMQQDLLRFFAGCGDLPNGQNEPATNAEYEGIDDEVKVDPRPTSQTIDIAYVMFFPNDFSTKDISNAEDAIKEIQKYEWNGSTDYNTRDNSYDGEILGENDINKPSGKNLNMKSGVSSAKDTIKTVLFGDSDIDVRSFEELLSVENEFKTNLFGYDRDKVEIKSVTVKGFASSHGYVKNNLELCNRRRSAIEKILKHATSSVEIEKVEKEDGSIISVEVADINGKNVNTMEAKIARAATAIFHLVYKDNNIPSNSETSGEGVQFVLQGYEKDKKNTYIGTENVLPEVTVKYKDDGDKYSYDNEYLYFSNIRSGEDNLIYKNIIEKIKYFDPAYHSVTPEGFNARLTFLHQCTRQGPTNSVSSGNVDSKSPDYLKYAGNLSFGRAPYCILRVGDFFNTKIIIDSLSIDYDNNGGVQWDLNPEGVGVQPMYANVTVGFKFLGGQDLSGPIERLQNAVTANYYANASVYSKHADTGEKYYDAMAGTNENYKKIKEND